jgi:S-methylmethionine-dependent homocysteine/selenocysteine methylase
VSNVEPHVTLLDGGTGRELLRIGAPFAQPEWSAKALLEAPEFVARVHEHFIAAGAEVITTNSYAVVPFHLGAERFAREGRRLAALAGQLARRVADASPRAIRVAGGLPPLCGSYRADLYDPEEARPILAVLLEALEPHVDLWLAETLSACVEAELVREMIGPADRAGLKPLWLSFTLADAVVDAPPTLRSGEPVATAVATALRLDAQALLFNCSRPEVMGTAISLAANELRKAGARAAAMQLGVYANAFVPREVMTEANAELSDLRGDISPPAYLAWARDWVQRGANIVGGCCGIGPAHIAALRELNGS